MAITTTYGLTTLQSEAQGNGFITGGQSGSDVIGLANGGYAVGYTNQNDTNGQLFPLFSLRDSAFTQTVDVGNPYGGPGIDMQGAAEMVRLANGNIAMVWDEGPGSSAQPGNNQVVGRIINPTTGVGIGDEFTVSSFIQDTDPEIAALTNGDFVVAMSNTADTSVWLQRMSSTGTRIGDQIEVSQGDATDPAIVGLADGGFAVAFVDITGDNTVYVQAFNANGTERTGGPVLIGQVGVNDAPAVAALPNGNFVVVYDDSGYGTSGGLSLNIVSPNGSNISGAFRVDFAATTAESNPDVTVLPNGQILVTWEHHYASTDHDIYARLFSSTGVPVAVTGVSVAVGGSTDPFIITSSGDNDENPSIAQIRQGVFVTSWSDAATDGSRGRITTEVNEIFSNVVGDAENDSMTASAIRDVFDGNGGTDTVSYAASTAGVTVNLSTGGVGGDAQGDSYSEVENVSGSNVADSLTGDTQANLLDGRSGGDTMRGVGNNDVYVIDNANDIVDEGHAGSNGVDTVKSSVISVDFTNTARFIGDVERITLEGSLSLNATGNGLNNLITGNSGINTLDGKVGGDVMRGVGGNDTYIVDNANDIVDETLAGSNGVDTIKSSIISVNLSNTARYVGDIERATLEGSGALNATGNALNNLITGNSGANTIDGKVGGDVMRGVGGNDVYVIDNANDIVDEALAGSNGVDTIKSSTISFDLSNTARYVGAIERATLEGSLAINATGNALNNLITGNGGANRVEGKGGADILLGLGGADSFVYKSIADSGIGALRDTINDFEDVGDNDTLDLSGFAGTLSYIGTAAFTAANQVRATQSGTHVLVEINTVGTTGAESHILLASTTIGQIDVGDFIV